MRAGTRFRSYAVLLCLAPGLALAGHACKKATRFSPALCDSGLPTVTLVNFKFHRAKLSTLSDPDTVDCSSFVVTKPLVREFFSKAKVVQGDTAGSLIDWSNCHASGNLLLANGKSAKWNIDQFRLGTLTYSDGKEDLFYCEDCRANRVPPHAIAPPLR